MLLRPVKIFLVTICAILGLLAAAPVAQAAGGTYTVEGGTARHATQIRAALDASSFDWGLVPAPITIHVKDGVTSSATPGHIWLNPSLMAAGIFSWATIQDEYAHQVDFFLFDNETRARLTRVLGGSAWCREIPGLRHSAYGCERFASTLVWAYWPSRSNAYKPASTRDESAAMAPAAFRTLMGSLLGAPTNLASR
jgi:hypothetical protein